MKSILIAFVAALTLAFSVTGCLEEKVLEVVAKGETSAEFEEDHPTANWNTPETIDLADEVRKILEDNGYSLDDIHDAKLVGAFYGVLTFANEHDWKVSGAITVRRMDVASATATIVDYAAQSVAAALGQKIAAPLNDAGVALINQALDDFRAGASPILQFEVVNDGVDPLPTTDDPIVFKWSAWITFHIVVEQTVEDVPDPF
jgi:hypothetical protein